MFTWRWGTPDRWVNPLRWGKKNDPALNAILQPRHLGVHFLKIIEWSRKQENAGKPLFLVLILFYTRLLLLL